MGKMKTHKWTAKRFKVKKWKSWKRKKKFYHDEANRGHLLTNKKWSKRKAQYDKKVKNDGHHKKIDNLLPYK